MTNQEPIEKARKLILSLSSRDDANKQTDELDNLPHEELNQRLIDIYNTAPTLAEKGDVKGISLILRIFEHFSDRSHHRMLLHYIAQAEANSALSTSTTEAKGTYHHEELKSALEIISAAFEDANAINKEMGTK